MGKGVKQIKARLSEEEVRVLEEVKKKMGFRSDYQFAKAAVRVMLGIMQAGMEQPISDLPREIADVFYKMADHCSPDFGVVRKKKDDSCMDLLLKRNKPFVRKDTGISRSVCMQENVYAEQFVSKHYDRLHSKAMEIRKPTRSDGYTPMDIFQSTIEHICSADVKFDNYEQFEEWALKKFKE